MRKITVLEHINLDGVIQAGGGPDEDTSDGFAYGGWAAPFDDDAIGSAVKKMLDMPIVHQVFPKYRTGAVVNSRSLEQLSDI